MKKKTNNSLPTYFQGKIEKAPRFMISIIKKASSVFLAQGTRTNLYTKMVMAEYDNLSQFIIFAS